MGCEAHAGCTGNFHLGIQGAQGNHAVRGGQGVGDVAAQGGGVAHLRAADQVAGFHQGAGVLKHQRRKGDLAHGHGRADEQVAAADFEQIQFGYGGEIYQGVDRLMPALLQLQQEVGSSGNGPGWPRCGCKSGRELRGWTRLKHSSTKCS